MSASKDLTFQARRLGKTPCDGVLSFTSNGLMFRPAPHGLPEQHIARHEIIDFSVSTSDTRKEEVSPLWVYFIGILAFLFPQRSGDLSITMTIQTPKQLLVFLVDEKAIEALRSTFTEGINSKQAT